MTKSSLCSVLAAAMSLTLAGRVDAFTSKTKAAPLAVTGSGVTPSQSLTVSIVNQGSGVPGTAGTLSFGAGGNTFRDSGEALKVDVNTNLAANRIIIYTDNLNAAASPKYCDDTSKGNDGGGLVGVTDCKVTVPMLWALPSSNPSGNIDYVFTTATIGDDEVFITDLAHVATFVDAALGVGAPAAEKQKLDILAMKNCATGVVVANPDNAGTPADPERYPQFFGASGAENDLCNAGAAITINGTAIAANAPIPFAQELSKNIAVVAFNFLGTTGLAPNLSTASTTDSITVTSPFYLPLGADFRNAPGQDYGTSTLTLELVTQ